MPEIKQLVYYPEFHILASGPWEKISKVARASKRLVELTLLDFHNENFNSEISEIERKALEGYTTPSDGESFPDYIRRANNQLTPWQRIGQVVKNQGSIAVASYDLPNAQENYLHLDSRIKENRINLTIFGVGIFGKARSGRIYDGLLKLCWDELINEKKGDYMVMTPKTDFRLA